jgi:hypothetical protein
MYSEENDEGDSCIICLVPFAEGTDSLSACGCGHVLHTLCLAQWSEVSPSCPTCKAKPTHGRPLGTKLFIKFGCRDGPSGGGSSLGEQVRELTLAKAEAECEAARWRDSEAAAREHFEVSGLELRASLTAQLTASENKRAELGRRLENLGAVHENTVEQLRKLQVCICWEQ